jgi:monoterpene epsilon-lactone hydrolase
MPSAEHQQIVDQSRSANDPAVELTVEGIRAVIDLVAAQYPAPTETIVTPFVVGGVPAERIDAPGLAADAPTILHAHGGAYIAGSLAFGRALCARVSRAATASVVSLDYRLAPEHPFPAALDDVTAAYRGLLDGGVPPERLVLFGDSAGGGLVHATLLALRAAGDPLPAGAVLVSPWVDLDLTGESIGTKAADDPLLTPALLALAAAAYRPDGTGDPLASPLRADPSGLPPLLVLVGTAEILLDDSLRLAERASAVGLDVTLEVGEDLVHVWPLFAGVPEAEAAVERIGAWIRARSHAA